MVFGFRVPLMDRRFLLRVVGLRALGLEGMRVCGFRLYRFGVRFRDLGYIGFRYIRFRA